VRRREQLLVEHGAGAERKTLLTWIATE